MGFKADCEILMIVIKGFYSFFVVDAILSVFQCKKIMRERGVWLSKKYLKAK